MAIYALGDVEPDIRPDAYVHPDAVVIGNVTLGSEVSVWSTAVLRGDDGRIEVGARTSVRRRAGLLGAARHAVPRRAAAAGGLMGRGD